VDVVMVSVVDVEAASVATTAETTAVEMPHPEVAAELASAVAVDLANAVAVDLASAVAVELVSAVPVSVAHADLRADATRRSRAECKQYRHPKAKQTKLTNGTPLLSIFTFLLSI